jgi:hypothetical protein
VFETGVHVGHGLVTITYTLPTLDATAPTSTIALVPASPDGLGGWYVSTVHATVSAADEAGGSGVSQTRCALDPAAVPATFADLPANCVYTGAGADVTTDGSHALHAASTDEDGNAEAPVSKAFKLDRTAPTVTCTAAPSFLLGQAHAVVSASLADATSGPAAATVSTLASTGGVGAKTASLVGFDLAGNASTTGCPYTVAFAFAGFQTPVDNDGVLNVAKPGKAIALKWRLLDAQEQPVTDLASVQVTAQTLSCSLATTSDQVEQYAPRASALQNLGDGYYQLNWKSPTSYANSCKTLQLDLGEGSPRTALFKFTK